MSQMTVLAKVPAIGVPDLEADYTGILEPGPPTFRGLLAARTLAPVRAVLTYVRVMNLTTADIQVPCDTRLGDFHPVGDTSKDDYLIAEAEVATVTALVDSTPQQTLPYVDLGQLTLTDQHQQRLKALLLTYSDVFSAHDQDYGHTNLVRHSVRTTDTPPIKQRAYITSPNIRAEIDRQVQQHILVRKKDGSYRFCIDDRKLNAATIIYSYPLPHPAVALDSLSGACWFSTMDLSSGYWQVELEPQDEEKTAFSTGTGTQSVPVQSNVAPLQIVYRALRRFTTGLK